LAIKKIKNEVAEEEVEVVPEWLQKMRVGETVDYAGGVNFINSDVGSAGTMGSTTDGTTTEDGKSEWEKYKDQYIADQTAMYTDYGKRAMQDTVGEISARTGGLASSYAGIVGQETYDNYMQELAAKYPDLVAAAMEMYNLENPKAKSNNWTYGIASNGTTAKKEDAKKKATAKKTTEEAAKEKENVEYYYGFTQDDADRGIRGLNPYWVDKNTSEAQKEENYQDDVFRAVSPLYSSVIDPYYVTGVPTATAATKAEEEEKTTLAKRLLKLLYGE
jgi:hypothetical protein